MVFIMSINSTSASAAPKRKEPNQTDTNQTTLDPFSAKVADLAKKKKFEVPSLFSKNDPTPTLKDLIKTTNESGVPLTTVLKQKPPRLKEAEPSSLEIILSNAQQLYEQKEYQAVLDLLKSTSNVRLVQGKIRLAFLQLQADCSEKLGDYRSAIYYYNQADFREKDPQKRGKLRTKLAQLNKSIEDLNKPTPTIDHSLPPQNTEITTEKSTSPSLEAESTVPTSESPKLLFINPAELMLPMTTAEAEQAAKKNLQQGLSYLDSGDIRIAIANFLQGLNTIENNPVPHLTVQLLFHLGSAYYRQTQYELSAITWNKCIALVNDNLRFKAQLIRYLALAYVKNAKHAEAAKLLWNAINNEFSGDEQGKLILCLADVLMTQGILDKNLLLSSLQRQSSFSDEIKLQFCNKLLKIFRETNDFETYKEVKDMGAIFKEATAETKISFLFENAQTAEAQGSKSEAMEIYEFLLTQNISYVTKQILLIKLGQAK